jgi:dTDP-4-amino-4,6-dideoxygalactose transaminase
VKVNMVNLDREIEVFGDKIKKLVCDVIDSNKYISGPECKELEEALADRMSRKFCVLVGNGTDALEIAISAVGLGKNSSRKNIAVPDFTFGATAEAVINTGNNIVPVAVSNNTFQLSKDTVDNMEFSHRIDAIIPVSLFGLMSWPEFLGGNKAPIVIEDAAQGFGAEYNGAPSGSFGDVSCFSFYPTKTLGGYGDGGCVLTDNREIAEMARYYANHALSRPYIHGSPFGRNSRMDTIQAAIVLAKLRNVVEENVDRKREIAAAYNDAFRETGIIAPEEQVNKEYITKHAYHQYTVLVENRDTVREMMTELGVSTQVFYPTQISAMPGFREMTIGSPIEETKYLCDRVLSLPICPYMKKEEVEYVIECMIKSERKAREQIKLF